jgi:hypothetical protein
LRAFEHPLQAQPRGERQTLERAGRRFARIERDQAEIAGLEDQRQCPNRLLEGALIHVAA